jgi:hypothetical protein
MLARNSPLGVERSTPRSSAATRFEHALETRSSQRPSREDVFLDPDELPRHTVALRLDGRPLSIEASAVRPLLGGRDADVANDAIADPHVLRKRTLGALSPVTLARERHKSLI